MLKLKLITAVSLGILLLNGCAKINDGIADGIAYTVHSAAGIDFPAKTGKIYLESTIKEDTKNITPLNAQLYGFDSIVASDLKTEQFMKYNLMFYYLMQNLKDHGWEITKNKDEADYHIYTSLMACGNGYKKGLSLSTRLISMKERTYFKAYVDALQRYNIKGTVQDILNENEEVLAKITPYFNLGKTKQITNSHTTAHGVGTGASTMQYSSKGGTAIMLASILLGSGEKQKFVEGFNNQIKVYNPDTNKTTVFYLDGIGKQFASMYEVDTFASGIFYK